MSSAVTVAAMSFTEVALLLIAVAALLFVAGRVKRIWLAASEKKWLPKRLQSAELVYIEQVFRTQQPLRLVARVDRAYRQPNGVIILLELKTRGVNRPYFSDVIELSAQRVAIQGQTGERVDEYGYVLIQQTRSRAKICHGVRLLSSERVIALARRRDAIIAGKALPHCTRSDSLCEVCAFRPECKGPG